MPVFRWLALSGAGGAAVVSALNHFQIAGPWASVAVIFALMALFAVFALNLGFQSRAARIVAEASLHAVDSATQKLQFRALARELETHKQLEQELTEAKQAAEAAMMAKGEFLATMSHEIRTPLNGILPMLEMLRGSRLDSDQKELLTVAHTSARQLLRIVDDILDYSKLEANKFELEVVAFNLRELLDSVIRLMSGAAEKKGLRLVLRYDDRVRPLMRGDPTRLRQVLTNLVSNAVKFTERGSVTVSVAMQEANRTHQMLRFEVRDTGVGVAADKLGLLFTPFTQANAATTRIYGGTGLGLAISKRIMDLMGGRIGAQSEHGAGSTFWFELGLLKAVGDIADGKVDLGAAHVLMLTADAAIERRLQIAFTNWGVRFQFASNTQEALELLRAAASAGTRKLFHILVADLNTVRTTAVALHRNIRREPELDALKVIYLRGQQEVPLELIEPDRVRILPRGCEDALLRVQLSDFLTEQPIDSDSIAAKREPAALAALPAWRVPERESARPQDRTAVEANTPATRDDEHRRLATAPAATRQSPLKGRLLLVEDNPVNLMVAQRLLSSLGLECVTASNGAQALDRMAEQRFDLVLMDCQMPVLDGYSASRSWRERERQAGAERLPIIAMTANAMAGDRQTCLDAGMDDYLTKPVARDHLIQTLRRWLPESDESEDIAQSGASDMATSQSADADVAAPTTDRLPTVEATPALDRGIVEDLQDMMGAEFARLVAVYLEDSPGQLLTLQAAAFADDVAAMIAPAHSLKSASANLGALEFSELARQVEHQAREKRLAEPVAAAIRLAAEYERVEQALKSITRPAIAR